MSIQPYFADGQVTVYLGDFVDVIPALGFPTFDAVVTDPPYAETNLAWDRWPKAWPQLMQNLTSSMWCFGSMRMFLDQAQDFAGWKMSQDVVWEKHNGSSLAADRFNRVHEHALHWYRGAWADIHHEVPTEATATARVVRRKAKPAHHQGARGPSYFTSEDGGPRLVRSVIQARSTHGHAIHPTEKPTAVLDLLIRYAVPVRGVLLDPFAGSCSTGLAARRAGRRAVCIEANEAYLEKACERLSQPELFEVTA